MTFVTPLLAIAGALAVAIPIIIFLLWRQRRTPIEWAAMRFLLEAWRKHRRRLQVEQILLLAVRCLILALLGLALARPLLEGAGLPGAGTGRVVYLVVDDGLAAGVTTGDVAEPGRGPGVTALDGTVDDAVALVESLEVGDRVGVITAARPATAVLSPPSSDRSAVVSFLRAMKPKAAPTDLAGAFDRLRDALDGLESDHDRTFVYLLSEFRAGSAALEDILPSALPATLVEAEETGRVVLLAAPPASEAAPNVQITAVEPARRVVLAGALDGSGQVTVRLERQGSDLEREVTRVRLVGEAVTHVEPKVVEWGPGQTRASAEFLLEHALQADREVGISVMIESDALDADNERHTVLDLRRRIRVVLLDRHSFGAEPSVDRLTAGQWMRRALEPGLDGPVEVVLVEPAALDLADLRTADAAFLPRPDLLTPGGWDLLRSFVDKGGLLVLSPPADLRVHQWIDDLDERLGLGWALNREVRQLVEPIGLAAEQPSSPLLRMVSSDLAELARPVITTRFLELDESRSQAEVILRLAGGEPFMVAGSPHVGGDGDDGEASRSPGLVVALVAAPELAWTNLPAKPLMVPLVHEVLRQGLSLVRATGTVHVGGRPALLVGPAASRLVGPDGTTIPLDRTGRPESSLAMPGLYRVEDSAAQAVGAVAANVDAAAGRTDTQVASAVEAWLARSGPWTTFDPADLGAAMRRAEGGSPLAGILLAIVLALVLLETVLARLFSHAMRDRGAEGRALRPTMIEREAATGAGGAA